MPCKRPLPCKGCLKLYQAVYQDYRMSLYSLVNEKVGSVFSQGIGYVTNTMDLVRNYTTMPISETFGTSGMSWFSPTVTDVFDNPDGTTDGSGNPDPSANSSSWGKTYAKTYASIRSTTNRPVWAWVVWGIGWIFALTIASIVANEMIMLPYQMRLIGFVAVLLAYYLRPLFFYCILIYTFDPLYILCIFSFIPKILHMTFLSRYNFMLFTILFNRLKPI